MIRQSFSRKLFVALNYLFFVVLILLCIYPLWYILIASLSQSVSGGGVLQFFVPQGFTLSNYVNVFKLEGIAAALGMSVLRTVVGTCFTVFTCMLLGYLFSKHQMPFRTFLYRMLVVMMYVSGGLIPTYLVIKSYQLTNSFWVYILPNVVMAYYVILIKTFVEQLPASVEESAMLDGAGTINIFLRIILPMSLPIIATIAVYAAVQQWNSWFDNHIYNYTNKNLTTLQYMLYNFLNQAEQLARQIASSTDVNVDLSQMLTPRGVRMTVTVVTVVPVLFVYPFLQRYFVKGIMIGAVKG